MIQSGSQVVSYSVSQGVSMVSGCGLVMGVEQGVIQKGSGGGGSGVVEMK